MDPEDYAQLKNEKLIKAELETRGEREPNDRRLLQLKLEPRSDDEEDLAEDELNKLDELDEDDNVINISFDQFTRTRKSEIYTRHVVKRYRPTYTKGFVVNMKTYPFGYRFDTKKEEKMEVE